jgi:hypothetical protein
MGCLWGPTWWLGLHLGRPPISVLWTEVSRFHPGTSNVPAFILNMCPANRIVSQSPPVPSRSVCHVGFARPAERSASQTNSKTKFGCSIFPNQRQSDSPTIAAPNTELLKVCQFPFSHKRVINSWILLCDAAVRCLFFCSSPFSGPSLLSSS